MIKQLKLNTTLFCTLLLLIGTAGALAIDMYVPSLPNITKALSTTNSATQYSISLYLISYGFGQLFYGPLSDSIGRKPVMLIGAFTAMLGGIYCVYSHTIHAFYIGRLLQGAGYSAVAVTLPAIAKDQLDNKQFAQAASAISMVFGLIPIASPILGAHIDHAFGWRMIFIGMTGYTLFTILVMLFVLSETHNHTQRTQLKFNIVLSQWKEILKNRIFLANALCKSATYSAFIIFYTVTPFIMQDKFHLSIKQYSWVTFALASTALISKLFNTILLRWFHLKKLTLFANWLLAFSGCLLLFFALIHSYTTATILIPFLLAGFASGFLFSNATVAAFEPFASKASGSVSALLSGLQMLTAFAGSAIVAKLPLDTLLPLASLLFALGVLSLLIYITLATSNEPQQQKQPL